MPYYRCEATVTKKAYFYVRAKDVESATKKITAGDILHEEEGDIQEVDHDLNSLHEIDARELPAMARRG